jgi:putative addiction module component (TIGR02574 family)
MNPALAAEISRLTSAEKLLLVEQLWDNLASSEDRLQIPPWHEQVLAEDQAIYQAKPIEGSSWPDAKKRILDQS